MKVYSITENEIEQRLQLDARVDSGAFCKSYNSSSEVPADFYYAQNELRNSLEEVFWQNFDDGIDRSGVRSWEREAMSTLFYFVSDLIGAEQIAIQISEKILSDKSIGVILSYLAKQSSDYAVILIVHEGSLDEDNQIGCIVVNQYEIAIDERLTDLWREHVKWFDIEAKS